MVEAPELNLFGTYAGDPVGFASDAMCVSMSRAAKCLLRSLLRTGRLGISHRHYPSCDVRILEVVIAVWRLLTHRGDDVMVALPDELSWGIWLEDSKRVLAHARAELQREVSTSSFGIMHRGSGLGKVWCFLGGSGAVPEPRGKESTLIVSGMEDASTETIRAGCAKFAAPRLVVVTSYKQA